MALMYSFSYLEPVCWSMSSFNCCFLTCIQVSQETDQVVWYSHLFQNFPQFIVIHTVKGFGIVLMLFLGKLLLFHSVYACSVAKLCSDSVTLWTVEEPTRLLCPWGLLGKNTGVSHHSLLQGIFPTQGLNMHLLHWQTLSHLG